MSATIKITIEDLAVKLNGKMWTKGDLKRIYLERGYNTKKMSTKTYVEETKTGDFNVKCFIDCPAQNYNWIKIQQEEVVENVESEIAEIIELTKVELVEVRLSQDETEVEVKISHNGNVEENFLTETEFDERFNKYPQSVFDNLPETKRPEPKAVVKPVIAVTEISAPIIKFELGNGKKIFHNRFGLGEITEEVDGGEKLRIVFETEGEKLLLARFANLTFL